MSELTAPDPDDLVAAHWPMPEAHTSEHLVAAVRTARELIRWANHATLNAPDTTMSYASEVGAVVAALAEQARMMRQLVFQLAGRAADFAEEPGLRHDMDGDPYQTIRDAVAQLGDAADAAEALGLQLNSVFQQLSRIGHTVPDDHSDGA